MSLCPRCEQCGSQFEPLDGGICPVCSRLLCGACLRGRWQSWLPRLGGGETCGRCRAEARDEPDGEGT